MSLLPKEKLSKLVTCDLSIAGLKLQGTVERVPHHIPTTRTSQLVCLGKDSGFILKLWFTDAAIAMRLAGSSVRAHT
eukprot:5536808-Amphidinium_carterae.1